MHPWHIFVEGFKNWKTNWLKLAAIYLSVYVPLLILSLFLAPKGVKPGAVQVMMGILSWLLDAFVMASLILAVKEQLNAQTSRALDTMKASLKHLFRYILTVLSYSVINVIIVMLAVIIIGVIFNAFVHMASGFSILMILAILAAVACIFAAIYCMIRFALSGTVCIMEEAGPVQSLKTSHNLITNKVPIVVGVFCFVLLPSLLLLIPSSLISLVRISRDSRLILQSVYQVFASAIGVPLGVSVMVILYKKLREVVS